MHLSTETKPDGIHCYFAGGTGKQAKYNCDRFCVIATVRNTVTGKAQYRLCQMSGHMTCPSVWNSLEAAEYAAFAYALEYVARLEEVFAISEASEAKTVCPVCEEEALDSTGHCHNCE